MIVTTVGGGGLVVTVAPARGGKIVSLRGAGREWLAQSDPLADPPAPGTDFVDAEMSGWDECVPTVGACRLGDRNLPDHGDLWDRPWQAGDDGWIRVRGTSLDYELGRRIVPSSTGVRIEYRATTPEVSFPSCGRRTPSSSRHPGRESSCQAR